MWEFEWWEGQSMCVLDMDLNLHDIWLNKSAKDRQVEMVSLSMIDLAATHSTSSLDLNNVWYDKWLSLPCLPLLDVNMWIWFDGNIII